MAGRERVGILSSYYSGVQTTVPLDEDEQLDATLKTADTDDLRSSSRKTLTTDHSLRDRLFAHFGKSPIRSVDEFRPAINRQFGETTPEHHATFEPVKFWEWFDFVNEYRDQEHYVAAARVYWPLLESLDGDMERVNGAYDIFQGCLVGHSTDMSTVSGHKSRR